MPETWKTSKGKRIESKDMIGSEQDHLKMAQKVFSVTSVIILKINATTGKCLYCKRFESTGKKSPCRDSVIFGLRGNTIDKNIGCLVRTMEGRFSF